MSENSAARRNRWVFGLAAIALVLGVGLVLDVPGKLGEEPSQSSGLDDTMTSGCRSSCEAKGSSAPYCVAYCACVIESLNDGRSRREFSQFLVAMSKDPSSAQFREFQSTTEACAETARSKTLEGP